MEMVEDNGWVTLFNRERQFKSKPARHVQWSVLEGPAGRSDMNAFSFLGVPSPFTTSPVCTMSLYCRQLQWIPASRSVSVQHRALRVLGRNLMMRE